jgi:hypothetical protein
MNAIEGVIAGTNRRLASVTDPKRLEKSIVGCPMPICVLDDVLYIGNASHAHDERGLRTCGITHIINCTKDIKNCWEKNSGEAPTDFKIEYLRIPVHDQEHDPIDMFFPCAVEFITAALEKKGKVLVHCLSGISRSAALILAFLIASKQMDLKSAYAHLRKKKPSIRINRGFFYNLVQFQIETLGFENSVVLEDLQLPATYFERIKQYEEAYCKEIAVMLKVVMKRYIMLLQHPCALADHSINEKKTKSKILEMKKRISEVEFHEYLSSVVMSVIVSNDEEDRRGVHMFFKKFIETQGFFSKEEAKRYFTNLVGLYDFNDFSEEAPWLKRELVQLLDLVGLTLSS